MSKVDNSTIALIVIDYPHHEIHDGSAYMAAKTFTHGAGASPNVLVVTPDSSKYAHFMFYVVSDDACTVTLYEGSDYGGGSALTAVNRNRNSNNTSQLTLTTDSADGGGGKGTAIWITQGGANAFLGSNPANTTSRAEVILKRDTKYLIEAVGAAGDVITVDLDWYEHTNYPR